MKLNKTIKIKNEKTNSCPPKKNEKTKTLFYTFVLQTLIFSQRLKLKGIKYQIIASEA